MRDNDPTYKYTTKKKKNNRFRPVLCRLTRARPPPRSCAPRKISKICYHCIPDRHAKSPPNPHRCSPGGGRTASMLPLRLRLRRRCLGARLSSALGSRAGARCVPYQSEPPSPRRPRLAGRRPLWFPSRLRPPPRSCAPRAGRRAALAAPVLPSLSRLRRCRLGARPGLAPGLLAGSVGCPGRLACPSRLASIGALKLFCDQRLTTFQVVQSNAAKFGRRTMIVTILQRPTYRPFHTIPRPSVIPPNVAVQQTHPVPVQRRRIRAQPVDQVGQIDVSGQVWWDPAPA